MISIQINSKDGGLVIENKDRFLNFKDPIAIFLDDKLIEVADFDFFKDSLDEYIKEVIYTNGIEHSLSIIVKPKMILMYKETKNE